MIWADVYLIVGFVLFVWGLYRLAEWCAEPKDYDGWQTDEYLWERDRVAKLRALAAEEGREAVVEGKAGLPK